MCSITASQNWWDVLSQMEFTFILLKLWPTAQPASFFHSTCLHHIIVSSPAHHSKAPVLTTTDSQKMLSVAFSENLRLFQEEAAIVAPLCPALALASVLHCRCAVQDTFLELVLISSIILSDNMGIIQELAGSVAQSKIHVSQTIVNKKEESICFDEYYGFSERQATCGPAVRQTHILISCL